MKPYSESCDQNKVSILNVIQPLFSKSKKLLEIASGTGQHAVYFAEKIPHLNWQTSDLVGNHAGINQWLDDAKLTNVKPPISLAACDYQAWKTLDEVASFDTVFSANAVHIMGKEDVICLFKGIAEVLPTDGLLALYGPFNYDGKYTSESNARFDVWLKDQHPQSGIRDFEWLDSLANDGEMVLQGDHELPANNRILVWKKQNIS